MISESGVQVVLELLHSDSQAGACAVLDGAGIPELRAALCKHKPEHFCLMTGELTPDLAAAAPYVVELRGGSEFTRWLLTEGWGKNWGILAQSPANLRVLRNHFRSLLRAQMPDGKVVLFRFYDPRVLRTYLPTCTKREQAAFFGPITTFLLESAQEQLLLYRPGQPRVAREEIPLPAPDGRPA